MKVTEAPSGLRYLTPTAVIGLPLISKLARPPNGAAWLRSLGCAKVDSLSSSSSIAGVHFLPALTIPSPPTSTRTHDPFLVTP